MLFSTMRMESVKNIGYTSILGLLAQIPLLILVSEDRAKVSLDINRSKEIDNSGG